MFLLTGIPLVVLHTPANLQVQRITTANFAENVKQPLVGRITSILLGHQHKNGAGWVDSMNKFFVCALRCSKVDRCAKLL